MGYGTGRVHWVENRRERQSDRNGDLVGQVRLPNRSTRRILERYYAYYHGRPFLGSYGRALDHPDSNFASVRDYPDSNFVNDPGRPGSNCANARGRPYSSSVDGRGRLGWRSDDGCCRAGGP